MEGKVRDANTHRDISSVNIFIEELNIGTVSNAAGRFKLKVVRPEPDMIVTFQHIAYDTLQLVLEEVLSQKTIHLQERVILASIVEVESIEEQFEIEKDLPQTISILNSRSFDLHGYSDAGDLLRTDHSIQVDEELSGKKTVSIRGGNPDEVIVLYNGIRMNNTLDNVFDISLIDLNDLERLEVIKGSNTALYGPEAFSGVINVIPRAQQDYNIHFRQRFGSFDTGDWGLNLYKNIGNLHGSASAKQGSSKRQYADAPEGQRLLKNDSQHYSASLAYNFSETAAGYPTSSLGLMYFRSDLDYENERNSETLNNFNQMISARYTGNIGDLRDISLSGAFQWLDENQFLRFFDLPSDSGFLARGIENRAAHFNADKSFYFKNLKLLLGYQHKNAKLDLRDDRILFIEQPASFAAAELKRINHGFISIAKLKGPTQSDFLKRFNFDFSFRYDVVKDKQFNSNFHDGGTSVRGISDIISETTWKESMFKLSTSVAGNNGKTAFNAFFNVGNNVKFPTLLQQISTRELLSVESDGDIELAPEKNRSVELGIDISREVRDSNIYGWQITTNVFRNDYKNKFRSCFLPGPPIAVYDNVPDASITGLETKQRLFLFRKKVTFEFGASRYFFSDAATFPFKHDRKFTFNLRINEGGYAFQLFAFKEGEQVAQIRNLNGGFSQVRIPSFANMDIHFSKSFSINKTKLFLNASLRNIADDDFQLEGLVLRDRRYYITLGIQY